MAKLSEFKHVFRTVGPWTFLKRVYHEIQDDGVFTSAAAMAYSWVFAIFPFLIFLLTLVPLLPEKYREDANAQIAVWLKQALPNDQAVTSIMTVLSEVTNNTKGGLLSLGIIATLWAASGGMSATMTALDKCYDIKRSRNFLLHRLVAVALTVFGVCFVLMVVVLVPLGDVVLGVIERLPSSIAENYLSFMSSWMRVAIDFTRYGLGLLLMMLLVSTIYQFGPSVRRHWVLITPGAVFAVLTMLLLAVAAKFYFGEIASGGGYAKTYGAVGGVVVLMLMLYLYAVVFLIGAEINSEIDFAVLGIRTGEHDEPVEPLPRLNDDPQTEKFKKKLLDRQRSKRKPLPPIKDTSGQHFERSD